MQAPELKPARKPRFYFIGVTTAKSSIMKVFPRWADSLRLGECEICGVDCKWHDDPEVYRRIVSFIKHDPLSLGGLVTTHKIDLFTAARDLFDTYDSYAALLGEVSCISKQNGRLIGHAKDPITSGLSAEAFIADGYWRQTQAEVCLLGAGGSSLAFATYLLKTRPVSDRPSKIHVTNRSLPRLENMQRIIEQINPGISVNFIHAPQPELNDAVVSKLASGSLVVNATGLGKDAPGSPVTEAAIFPESGLVWEFNYRGDLLFLRQAAAQKDTKRLHIEDGWTYFLHGWTRVLAEVFHIDIPVRGPEFEQLAAIASEVRQ